MLNIRKIRPADLASVMEINDRAFASQRPETYFQRLLRKYPEDFYVAEKDNEVVGYVLGHIKAEGLGWIKIIAVRHSHQGQGVGGAMMEFITDKLKAAGAQSIGLHARTGNQKGASFYQDIGFQIIETLPQYYSNGESAYRLEKKI
ncbi:MAG: GNAT family N-acetyltransferase [Candidatus Nealsonbacteria bacterium]|nr:GNAT family N-acetyltransferase [Candidatus Nealsonbacteria bacterium]